MARHWRLLHRFTAEATITEGFGHAGAMGTRDPSPVSEILHA
jgi:hypothetical protein